MPLEKYQKFLKNKHKFDATPGKEETVARMEHVFGQLKEGILKDDPVVYRRNIAQLVEEILKFENTKDIDFLQLLDEELNLTV